MSHDESSVKDSSCMTNCLIGLGFPLREAQGQTLLEPVGKKVLGERCSYSVCNIGIWAGCSIGILLPFAQQGILCYRVRVEVESHRLTKDGRARASLHDFFSCKYERLLKVSAYLPLSKRSRGGV
jgi:hypothetical protein